MKKEVIEKIKNYCDKAVRDWGVPGGLAAIYKDGETLMSEGFGTADLGTGVPMKNNTLFSIGSCTKAFTAAGLGMMVDEGKLTWDDKVISHLPDFKMLDPWVTKHVTIRDLVNHKLGIQRWNRLMMRDHRMDMDDVIYRMRFMKHEKEFRTRFHYGNEQFFVAGKVLEKVSGMRYDDFLKERIFKPLGMTSSFTDHMSMLDAKHPNFARGHLNDDPDLFPREMRLFRPMEPTKLMELWLNPAGSIWSTLGDIKKWIQMFLNGGKAGDVQLLKPETVAEITTPQFIVHPQDSVLAEVADLGITLDFESYAFGWWIMGFRGRKFVVHGGNTTNGNTVIGFLPEENLGVATFSNTYAGILHILLTFYILDTLAGREVDYSGAGLKLAKEWEKAISGMVEEFVAGRKTGTSPSLPTAGYPGRYFTDVMGDVFLESSGDKILFHYGDEYHGEAEHWQDDTFLVRYDNGHSDAELLEFDVAGGACKGFTIRSLEGEVVEYLERLGD